MSEYIIITDACCDITNEMAEALGVVVLPLSINMGDKSYRIYPDGREITVSDYYKELRNGAMPTTNAVSVGEFMDSMELFLKEGRDVLLLPFSSGLSTTYNSSVIAAEELRDKYPDRKIYTVDTFCVSMGLGLLIWYIVQMQRNGKTIEEARDWAENNKLKLCHWFTVSDLNHLKRGGRISAATALVGTMLGIKPVLHVDNDGHLINMFKARGRPASLAALVSQMERLIIAPETQTIFICHSDCMEDAEWLKNKIIERLKVKEVHIGDIDPVIGAHTGADTVAVFFMGTER